MVLCAGFGFGTAGTDFLEERLSKSGPKRISSLHALASSASSSFILFAACLSSISFYLLLAYLHLRSTSFKSRCHASCGSCCLPVRSTDFFFLYISFIKLCICLIQDVTIDYCKFYYLYKLKKQSQFRSIQSLMMESRNKIIYLTDLIHICSCQTAAYLIYLTV